MSEPIIAPPQPTAFPPTRGDSPSTSSSELFAVLLAGFFGNLVVRTGAVASAASVLVIVVLSVAMVATGRIRRRDPLIFLGLAMAVAPWLAVRSDAALTAMNVAMLVILFGVATGLSLRGSAFDARVRDLATHVGAPMFEWVYGLAVVKRFVSLATSEHTLAPLVRGVVVAVPVLVLFTSLLAAADDVFASFLLLDDLPSVVGHVVLTLVLSVGLFGWVSRSAHETAAPQSPRNIQVLGPLEVTMILGSLATLFAAFVATQVVVAAGGAAHVLETEGLTQADHARRGFFQLLWVAALATALVGGVRALRVTDPERGRDRFRPLALLTLGLTLVICAVSLERLRLYVESFGLTPLRFWALAGAGGIALLIVAYAGSVSGWRSGRQWFPGVAIVIGALFTIGLNVVNPDARVAEHNIRRAGPLDVEVLDSLSDDAVETMVAAVETNALDPTDAEYLRDRLCLRSNRQTSYGLFEYNAASVGADRALDRFCAVPGS